MPGKKNVDEKINFKLKSQQDEEGGVYPWIIVPNVPVTRLTGLLDLFRLLQSQGLADSCLSYNQAGMTCVVSALIIIWSRLSLHSGVTYTEAIKALGIPLVAGTIYLPVYCQRYITKWSEGQILRPHFCL